MDGSAGITRLCCNVLQHNELYTAGETAGLADEGFSPMAGFARWHHPPKQVLQMALCQNTLTISMLARQSILDSAAGIPDELRAIGRTQETGLDFSRQARRLLRHAKTETRKTRAISTAHVTHHWHQAWILKASK